MLPQELPPTIPEVGLDEPPPVTCKGWAIAEGETGNVLWGQHADQPMKAASTTKMMCLYVVLALADRDAKVMDELVVFSKFADDTDGSTADIRVGESLPVRDCLYGLMLPSGNDAGNALAEHFNARLAPPDSPNTNAKIATRANFIAEMNRQAAKLKMEATTYYSPYGDGALDDQRTTSPADLLRLASAGLKHPIFRTYVGTRRYECSVRKPEGGTRKIVWENTNQLLKIEGYDGVKTGTTTAAGNCLVSSCRRGDKHLLIAVLGSTSSDGRYVDSRNLYRWAWQQLTP